ncbi:hypothetical protein HYU07_04930 [Candidatus Woesearchaeota archaeon]|nr:hypothetical protein [Candidatus Woesearchaeota archaeon]
MTKALITLGYHYGEIDWGRAVREEYLIRNLKGDRNIAFHEIKGSNVKTGDHCKSSERETTRKIKEECFDLLLDIHCGFDTGSSYLDKKYYGIDCNVIERVRCLDSIKTYKSEPVFDAELNEFIYAGIPNALIDAFFFKNGLYTGRGLNDTNYSELIKIVSEEDRKKLLEETLALINKIYDAHQN